MGDIVFRAVVGGSFFRPWIIASEDKAAGAAGTNREFIAAYQIIRALV